MGDHIDLINGFAFLSENFSEDGIPVIKIRNVNTADFSRGNMQYHPYDPSLKKYIVEPGDLLIINRYSRKRRFCKCVFS